MGDPGPLDLPRRPRDYRPENPIRGFAGKTLHQGPRTRRRALEGTPEAQSQPGPTSGSRDGTNHARHKLVVRNNQAQKTLNLPVEEHPPLLDECEIRPMQGGADQLSENAQTTDLWKPPHYEPRGQAFWTQR